jgi:hypothetical protein
LRCYERDGAECRAADAPVTAWAALSALALVRDGIPTEIAAEIPHALAALRDDTGVRKRLIAKLRDHEGWARAGNCDPARVYAVGERALALAGGAKERISRLGLAQTETGGTVDELCERVRAVDAARAVDIECPAKQKRFLLVLAPTEGGAFRLVDLYEAAPSWMEDRRAPSEPHRARIAPAEPNLVDPFLPVIEEEL